MDNNRPHIETVTKCITYAEIELDLIRRHMFIETGKFIVGCTFLLLVLILIIIDAFTSYDFNSQALGWIAAAAGFVLASPKIKNVKDILEQIRKQ